jgi:hypothetical protein
MSKPGSASPWKFKFLGNLLLYNLVVFLIFLPVYLLIDFDYHFGAEKKATLGDKLYFALMTHSAAMAGDFVPQTATARRILSLHILLTWLQLLFVFYTDTPPTKPGGRRAIVSAAAGRADVIVAQANAVGRNLVRAGAM